MDKPKKIWLFKMEFTAIEDDALALTTELLNNALYGGFKDAICCISPMRPAESIRVVGEGAEKEWGSEE